MNSRFLVIAVAALCLPSRALAAQPNPAAPCTCLLEAQQRIRPDREVRLRIRQKPSLRGQLDSVVVAGMTPGICIWPQGRVGNDNALRFEASQYGDTLGVIADRVRNGAIFVPYSDISAIQYRIGGHIEPLVVMALGTLTGAVVGSLVTPQTRVCGSSSCDYKRQRTGWTAGGAVIGAAAGLVLSTILQPTRTIRCW